jgi:hypothetical protein
MSHIDEDISPQAMPEQKPMKHVFVTIKTPSTPILVLKS